MAKIVKMKNQNAEVTTEETVESVGYEIFTDEELKSMSDEDITKNIEEINAKQQEYAEYITNKRYSVKMSNKSLNALKKWLGNEVDWDHKSAPVLVATFEHLKNTIEAGVDENGNCQMSQVLVANLYNYLLKVQGKGSTSATSYVKMLTEVGGPITDGMRELADDNELFRFYHTDLNNLEMEQSARQQGIQVEDTPVAEDETPESEH